MRADAASVLLVSALALGCKTTNSCPTIDCSPEIRLAYSQPITGSYMALVVFQDVTYQANCPTGPISNSPPRISCDANGILLAGIDLGHGEVNEALDMTVEIVNEADEDITYNVTATLVTITNSEECELVCYQHAGTVAN